MGRREKERELMEQLHEQKLAARDQELALLKHDNERLKQEIEKLFKRVESYEKQEAAVLDAIIQARKTASETVSAAQEKAQEIYDSAVEVTAQAREISENARSIIIQAEEQAAEIAANAQTEAAAAIGKANERAAFILSEARGMSDDHQSLISNARERIHTLLSVSIENIRDFAAKMAILYSGGILENIEPLLQDSIRDIELHLKQIGAPPKEGNAPTLGYTDAHELIKALQRLQGPATSASSEAPASGGEERVWTVDEVMARTDKPAEFEPLSPTLERVEAETAPKLPALEQPPQELEDAPRAPHLPPVLSEDPDLGAEEGLV